MKGLTVKAERTGRPIGAKFEATEQRVTLNGIKLVLRQFDAWDGGSTAEEIGEYVRFTTIEPVNYVEHWNIPRTQQVAA